MHDFWHLSLFLSLLSFPWNTNPAENEEVTPAARVKKKEKRGEKIAVLWFSRCGLERIWREHSFFFQNSACSTCIVCVSVFAFITINRHWVQRTAHLRSFGNYDQRQAGSRGPGVISSALSFSYARVARFNLYVYLFCALNFLYLSSPSVHLSIQLSLFERICQKCIFFSLLFSVWPDIYCPWG